jgi:PAS domain S-box-containing protein
LTGRPPGAQDPGAERPEGPGCMRLRLTSMSAALALGITVAVGAACALGAWLYSLHHYETLLQSARASALGHGELIRAALEHQMAEKDRTLIARMIRSFGSEPPLQSVVLLDRRGRVRYTSGPFPEGATLSLGSPTCQACHRYPPDRRADSRVIETHDSTLLRTMIPIWNRPACHACHDPSHRINGVLLVDMDAGAIRAGMNRDLGWMLAGSGGLMLLLTGAIAVVFRVAVMRRLQRFLTTARGIAAGHLDQRVPAEGTDTLGWLAREFNAMADSMTGLVREVENQRERLERVINSIGDGIVVLDRERSVVAANRAFLQRTGRGRDEVLGACCHEAAMAICDAGDCPTQACFRTGERQVRIRERRAEDGSTVCEEVHASAVRDRDGSVSHVVEVWRDISERRAAEAKLAESHRFASLGMLASGFSHELNTPLATVLLCVEGILRQADAAGGSGDVAENARIAREQLLRCRGVIQHFLRLARGQAPARDLVDLGGAMGAVFRLIEPTARAHGVALELGPPLPGTHVRVNEAELQHVLLNLTLNAIQACSRGGHVRLAAEHGEPVRIRVSDDGCGIDARDQRRIFEPFCNLRDGGHGLGLFLSLNAARAWGGDISVRSARGAGATFEVVLPRVSA